MKQFRSLSTVVAATGLVWCVVDGWWIWTTPVRFSGIAGTMEPAGARAVERVEYRLISDISEFGILPLVVPVLLAAWATWAACRQRILALAVATVIFLVFCFIAGFSIGGAYVPVGLGLVIATLLGMLSRVLV